MDPDLDGQAEVNEPSMEVVDEPTVEEMSGGGADSPTRILGENMCPAFLTNTSKNVHLFFNAVPGTPVTDLHIMLEDAYLEDPLTCIKIIFNLGNVRKDGGGKQDTTNFCRSLLWAWGKNPDIILANIHLVHQHTSLKTLLNLMMYLVHQYQSDPTSEYEMEMRFQQVNAHKNKKRMRRDKSLKRKKRLQNRLKRKALRDKFALSLGEEDVSKLRVERPKSEVLVPKGMTLEKMLLDPRVGSKWKSDAIAEQFKKFCQDCDRELAKEEKAKKKAAKVMTHEIIKKAQSDPNLVRLYDSVVNLFCTGIKDEYERLIKMEQTGEKGGVGGLFGKWAPTHRGMHDKATGIAGRIMKKLVPLLDQEVAPSHYHKKYQEVLTKIRSACEVPEHFVGQGLWDQVNYNRMASRCRLLFGETVFKKHDGERYEQYLEESAKTALTNKLGKDGVKTGVLLPHEVTNKAINGKSNTPHSRMEVNLQWWGLVKACREAILSGVDSLGYCLPMCDVSGSMSGEPMEVAIALSLLLSESIPTDCPLHGQIMTFHEQPSLCIPNDIPDYGTEVSLDDLDNISHINDKLGDLKQRVEEVRGYDWGGSTDIEAAYELLLQLALKHELSDEFISKTKLVIFSDMEFNLAVRLQCRGKLLDVWETMHEEFKKMFAAAGYTGLPKIIFWNLRHSRSQPVGSKSEEGVVMLSGFSAGLLRKFLAGNLDEFTPMGQLMEVISGPLYAELVAPEE